MAQQLEEVRRSRELLAQPLIYVQLGEITLERPRLYYSPTDSKYTVNPRLDVKFSLLNRGSHAALGVDVTGYLFYSARLREEVSEISSRFFDVIMEKEAIAGPENDFFFPGRENALFLESLRTDDMRPINLPVVLVQIVFRNTYGACFRAQQQFQLHRVRDEERQTLANWHTVTSSYQVTYDRELRELSVLYDKDEIRWQEKFDQLKEAVSKTLVGETMKLTSFKVPRSFSVELITEEEYNTTLASHGYGQPIPGWLPECIVKNELEEHPTKSS